MEMGEAIIRVWCRGWPTLFMSHWPWVLLARLQHCPCLFAPTSPQDYKPPPYLIPNVDLTFDLHEESSTVVARLRLAPNHGASEPVALVLDGEGWCEGFLRI